MTYTSYVSELNHRIAKYGLEWVISEADTWFAPETLDAEKLEYSIGLMEYAANALNIQFPERFVKYQGNKLPYRKFPSSIELMGKTVGKWYMDYYWNSVAIPEFAEHNICVIEVGSAI